MAIVRDLARSGGVKTAHNVVYQSGNDHADTPSPTWETTLTFLTVSAAATETHIPFAYEAPVVSNTDAWVPYIVPTFLPSVPATVRF